MATANPLFRKSKGENKSQIKFCYFSRYFRRNGKKFYQKYDLIESCSERSKQSRYWFKHEKISPSNDALLCSLHKPLTMKANTVNVHVWAALFFTKLKPKIEGAAYPWIHLCLAYSKTYLIFIKLLKVPRKKHKRNWERVAVVKGVFECLSANLALQKFLQAINFRFTQTNKRQSLPRAI